MSTSPRLFEGLRGRVRKEEELSHHDPLDARNTFQDEILRSDGSGLIEAADIHSSSQGNPEWFGTKDDYHRVQSV